MRGVLVEPGKFPKEIEFPEGLKGYYDLLGCDCIESVCVPIDSDVVAFCDESGKLNGKVPNRALTDPSGDAYDYVAGPFVIVGCAYETGEEISLTDEQAEMCIEAYEKPEYLFYDSVSRSLISFPSEEEFDAESFYKTGRGGNER